MKQTLQKALRIAGNELLLHLNTQQEFRIKESQSSIVTVADLRSDNLIVTLIREKFPAHNIISEESGFRNYGSKYTWVIDPLDGTSNYASALPWFGTLITLFEYNTPFMAGAYLPVNDLLYFAVKGEGAKRNETPLKMTDHDNLRNSLCAFSVDFTDDENLLERSMGIYRNLIKFSRNIRSTNSLVDFIYVAEGKFGGCINLFTRIWDISGLGLIISEAGGAMKNINGNDIDFHINEDCAERNFEVMAGAAKIIGELKKNVLKTFR